MVRNRTCADRHTRDAESISLARTHVLSRDLSRVMRPKHLELSQCQNEFRITVLFCFLFFFFLLFFFLFIVYNVSACLCMSLKRAVKVQRTSNKGRVRVCEYCAIDARRLDHSRTANVARSRCCFFLVSVCYRTNVIVARIRSELRQSMTEGENERKLRTNGNLRAFLRGAPSICCCWV